MYDQLAQDFSSKQIYFSQLFHFFHFSPVGLLKTTQFFTVAGKVRASARQGQRREELYVCLGDLEVGSWEEWLCGISFSPFHLGSCCLMDLCCIHRFAFSLSQFSPSSLLHICLLLPSGREPSISSDTRTDSSTESYPYKHSHHESVVSHFSSDSQGTVICNVENDSMSQSSRDTGRDLHSGLCLPDSMPAPKEKKLGQIRNVCHSILKGTEVG